MATKTRQSYQCQVFRNHYFSLFKGIKENLDVVAPALKSAGILVGEAAAVDRETRTAYLLDAVEAKLEENVEFFWRFVSILRSLPALGHLVNPLEEGFWQPSSELPVDTHNTDTHVESFEVSGTVHHPTQQDELGCQSGEVVLPSLPIQDVQPPQNEMLAVVKTFEGAAVPLFGRDCVSREPGVAVKSGESQLGTANASSGMNNEKLATPHRTGLDHQADIEVSVPLRRCRMQVSTSEGTDEETMRLRGLEQAVARMASSYVLGEKARLEADYEEKCDSIRAECKQELDEMTEYYECQYNLLEKELKLADSAHTAEINFLKRTHEEEKRDLKYTQEQQVKMKAAELEQKEEKLKSLQAEYKRKEEEVQEMEARLEAMRGELGNLKERIRAKQEQVSELRKWRSLGVQRVKEEVKNKMSACKEIGELISQWFEGNRDEAIKKQIDGKIQDIKSKRRGSRTI